MNKKNIATTIILLLCTMWFTVIGSSFMNFMYQESKIVVNDPTVSVSNGVLVYDSKDDNKKQIQTLEFNDMSLGLKPVTGDLDAQTNIPSTVTDKNGTEGLYASVKVTAPAGLKIVVTNIKIETQEKEEDVKDERKNMFIAIKDVKDSAQSLEADTIQLATERDAIEDKEYTFLFWLDSKADKILKGSKISFEIQFVV